MNQIAQIEGLDLVGQVEDIYAFDRFHKFDIVLLDSMFHFAKNDREKEIGLIQRIISDLRSGSIAVICLPNTGNKVQILNQAIDFENKLLRLVEKEFTYRFEESETGHTSETDFKMIVVQK